MTVPFATDGIRGRITQNAPLAPLVWFKTGGTADWLFEPADLEDLREFLSRIGGRMPVMALGLGSNLIVRDGGVPGVVIRLGKAFATVEARRARGHRVIETALPSGVQAIQRTPAGWHGGADPRREGAVRGD